MDSFLRSGLEGEAGQRVDVRKNCCPLFLDEQDNITALVHSKTRFLEANTSRLLSLIQFYFGLYWEIWRLEVIQMVLLSVG